MRLGCLTWFLGPSNNQWKQQHTSSQTKVKVKRTISAQKMTSTIFWYRKAILQVDIMPRGTTISSEEYCVTLRKLRRAIQNNRRGIMSSGGMLLYDNERPHIPSKTKSDQVLDQPPYNPDLAPRDVLLFRYLKEFLVVNCSIMM